MQKFAFLDKKQHGTAAFPAEYYLVDGSHPRYRMAFHWHNEWELLRVIEGELLLTLDDESYRVRAGETVLIPGETLHGGEPTDCVYECLVFDLYAFFAKNDMVKPHLRPFYRLDVIPDRFFTPQDAPPARLLALFSAEEPSPCQALEVLAAVAELFAWLLREGRCRPAPRSGRWSARIKPVLEYIEEHYGEALSLPALAAVAGMNDRYFCKVFYSLTHTTPMSYVNYYRIEQAGLLLESTDLSITEIAARCGFWESSYFTKVFKKFKGTTPYRYRHAVRQS